MFAMDLSVRDDDRRLQMLTTALEIHLEKASRAEWVWKAAPRPHISLAYDEIVY